MSERAHYYNEIDPRAAQWLRNLIAAGLIPAGYVDERSIAGVRADDLTGYTQCHFFAGIGGWPYVLDLAAWPRSKPVWTGSCPCQPISCAGQHKGHADERHLWPAFYALISECKPAVIFGEQVAGNAGREWFAAVRADLERAGYACGGADLCAAGIGAPHIRSRLFWVADARGEDVSRPISQEGARLSGFEEETSAEHGDRSLPSGFFDCADPKSFSAADGLSRPVGQVRAFGNAIVPQIAAQFISAFSDGGAEC